MNRPKLRLVLSDEEHDRMNRARNNINLWVGYGMIVLLGLSGLMVFAGIAIRLAKWMVP